MEGITRGLKQGTGLEASGLWVRAHAVALPRLRDLAHWVRVRRLRKRPQGKDGEKDDRALNG